MTTYKLTYFNGMGRAETARLLFILGGIEYEDNRIAGTQWKDMKPNTPFGALPVLEVISESGTETLCQGKAIEFFVAKKIGRAGDNDIQQAKAHMIAECTGDAFKPVGDTMMLSGEEKKTKRGEYCKDKLPGYLEKFEQILKKANHPSGLFLGDKITWPDLALFQFINQLCVLDDMTVDVKPYPKVFALLQKVKSDPKIDDWVNNKRPKTSF